MSTYNFITEGSNKRSVLSKHKKDIKTANKKLSKEGLDTLVTPVSTTYIIDTKVTAKDYNGLLSGQYRDHTSFDSAKALAEKGYAGNSFKVQQYKVSESYEVSKEQKRALEGGARKSPTPGFDLDKDAQEIRF